MVCPVPNRGVGRLKIFRSTKDYLAPPKRWEGASWSVRMSIDGSPSSLTPGGTPLPNAESEFLSVMSQL